MIARNFQKMTALIRRFAQHRYAPVILLIYSILQSIFIPIPVDVMLAPMALGNRKKAFFFATIGAIGSTIGGLIGYGIGYLAFHTVAEPVLSWFCQFIPNTCPAIVLPWLQQLFAQYGVWVIAVSSMAPLIPYRFTILAAGLGHMALLPFLIVSFVVHWIRYAFVSWLAVRYGRQAMDFIRKKVSLAVLIIVLAALILYFILT